MKVRSFYVNSFKSMPTGIAQSVEHLQGFGPRGPGFLGYVILEVTLGSHYSRALPYQGVNLEQV